MARPSSPLTFGKKPQARRPVESTSQPGRADSNMAVFSVSPEHGSLFFSNEVAAFLRQPPQLNRKGLHFQYDAVQNYQ